MSNDYELNIDNNVEFNINIEDIDYTIELNNTTDYIIELNEQGPQGASGPKGETGDPGPSNTLTIGTVESGSTPSVTITGTSPNQILNFVLEQGEKGDTGEQGETGETGNGISSVVKTSTAGLVDTYTITYTNGTTSTFNVTNGRDGEGAVDDVKVNGTSVVTSGIANVELKTINNNSIVGSGNVDIDALPSQSGQSGKYLTTNGTQASWATVQQAPSTDNETISLNTDNELQAIGVIDNNTTTALKYWTGTKAQYDAIATKDNNTLYNITDDVDVTLTILQTLYPVGSLYMTTNNTCPLSALFGTWQLQSSSSLVTSVSASSTTPVKGNGMTMGLTDGTSNEGLYYNGTLALATSNDLYGASVGTTKSGSSSMSAKGMSITSDSTKSGIIADTSNLLTVTTTNINIFERIA